jgi:hypothetical protein
MTGAMSKDGIMETIKDLVNDKTFDRKNPEKAMANFEGLVAVSPTGRCRSSLHAF